MAKYKLIKEFPNSPDLGTITEFPTGNSWSEYWELVQELNIPLGTKFQTNRGTGAIYTVSKVLKDKVLITWEKDSRGNPGQTTYTIKNVNRYFKNGTWIEYKEPKVKEGDIVVLFKYRTGSCYSSKIGDMGTITKFSKSGEGFELKEAGGIWFTEDVRLATKEEIQKSQEVKINGYILEMNNGLAEFGCQSFTKSELQAYKKLLRDPINAKVIIGSTIINTEFLDKILDRF